MTKLYLFKKITKTILLLILITGAISASAQAIAVNEQLNDEVVIGVPKITDKTLSIITETALTIPGIRFEIFCNEHRIITFRYNRELFNSPNEIVKAFKKKNIHMPMNIKEGSTFKDVKELCNN